MELVTGGFFEALLAFPLEICFVLFCGSQGQNYVELLQGNGKAAGNHCRN